MKKFRKKGKLSLHYVGLFDILNRVGAVAYRLALPLELSMIYPVFQVSMLRKYLPDPSHILTSHTIQLGEDLTYEEESIAIVNCQVKKLCSKEAALVKVM